VAALTLSECDYVPLDYSAYAREVQIYLDETQSEARKRKIELDFTGAYQAARAWEQNGRAALDTARGAVERGDRAGVERVHRGLMKGERALLDPDGLAGRPWFKHLIYAPRPTYKALVLPALTEAIEAGDGPRARAELSRLTRALNRAAKAIQQ
jgi:N-acetylated-alpha-linked acidic dipeptidase